MLEKINIPPVPIIVVKDRLCEDDLEYLHHFVNRNKAVKREIKHPLNELNFTTKIGRTEYLISTKFDISGKQTLLEQFKHLILSQI